MGLDIEGIRKRYHDATWQIDNYGADEEVADSVEDIPALLAALEAIRDAIREEDK